MITHEFKPSEHYPNVCGVMLPSTAPWPAPAQQACGHTEEKHQPKENKEMTLPQHSRFNWDNPEYRSSDYWKWVQPGDTVSGEITDISTHTFEAKQQPDGTMSAAKTVPVLTVTSTDGKVTEVTCSNADLLDQVRKCAPQVGDRIHMEYLRDVPTSFGGKKKLFVVKHRPADTAPPATNPQQEEAPF